MWIKYETYIWKSRITNTDTFTYLYSDFSLSRPSFPIHLLMSYQWDFLIFCGFQIMENGEPFYRDLIWKCFEPSQGSNYANGLPIYNLILNMECSSGLGFSYIVKVNFGRIRMLAWYLNVLWLWVLYKCFLSWYFIFKL